MKLICALCVSLPLIVPHLTTFITCCIHSMGPLPSFVCCDSKLLKAYCCRLYYSDDKVHNNLCHSYYWKNNVHSDREK